MTNTNTFISEQHKWISEIECPKCGKEIKPDSNMKDGENKTIKCENCGEEITITAHALIMYS